MTIQILIADDNQDDANLLEHAFRTQSGSDLAIRAVPDGSSALGEVCNGPELQLLILDLYLPHLDAIEFVQKLKELDRLPKCPVVVLTSYPPPALREALLAGGVTAILEKPPDWDGYRSLADLLLNLLKGHG